MVDTRTRYDSTEDDPVRFGAPATVRFGDFPDEVRPQIKLWRKIAEKSHGNYKAGVSHFSCSFVWRADRRLRTLIGNDATGPCFPVGKPDDPKQWVRTVEKWAMCRHPKSKLSVSSCDDPKIFPGVQKRERNYFSSVPVVFSTGWESVSL